MEDNLSKRGNLVLGLLRHYVPRNDILISYGLDESSPYIEMIKYFFLRLCSSVGRHEVCPYILLITHYLSLVVTCFVTSHSLLITCFAKFASRLRSVQV